MSSALQNRLVGTIIIVALVVIFLPDLLDGEKKSNTQAFVDIPENQSALKLNQPNPFPAQEVIEATRRPVEIINESDITDSDQTTEVQAPATQNADEQEVTANDIPVEEEIAQQAQTPDTSLAQQTVVDNATDEQSNAGWVVQLGSFRHQKNVNELLDKLAAAGYRAFSRKVDTSAGRLTKVFVGPELERQKLDDSLSHLNQATGLRGKVTSFAEATN